MTTDWNPKIGELEGVSEETLKRIDYVSRPSGDGPSDITLRPSRCRLYL